MKKMKKMLVSLGALLIAAHMFGGCMQNAEKDASSPPDDSSTNTESAVEDSGELLVVHCLILDFDYGMMEANGAKAACDEYGAKFTYFAPPTYPDSAGQVDSIEAAIAMNADVIIIDAVDEMVAGEAAKKAIDQGIVITCSNSGVPEGVGLGLWGTDNYSAGGTGAEKMFDTVNGKGQVAVIGCGRGTPAAEDRIHGFVNYIESNYPDIEIVDIQWGADTAEYGADMIKTYLSTYPDLKGVFANNGKVTEGMIVGTKELNMLGKVVLIGYDSGELVNNGIKNGELYGSLMQSPYAMGYGAAKAGLEKVINDIEPPGNWFRDTGIVFVTKDNIDSDEAKLVMYD